MASAQAFPVTLTNVHPPLGVASPAFGVPGRLTGRRHVGALDEVEIEIDLDTHQGRAILDAIQDVEFSWSLHEANAQELATAIAVNLAEGPVLFDPVRREASGRAMDVTTRRLANYAASGCSLVDRVEALASADSWPTALQPKLRTLRAEVARVPAVAFFRVVRDAHLHVLPQHVAVIYGAPAPEVILAPRRGKRDVPKVALEYIERCGGYGVPLRRACAEQDPALMAFTSAVVDAIRVAFATVLADYYQLEAETRRVYAIAWPEAEAQGA